MRFSSVCKSWHSLIHTQPFISSHLQHLSPSSLLICNSTNTLSSQWSLTNITPFPSPTITTLEPSFPTPLSSLFRFVESLNGVVCLVEQSFLRHAIILWNPSIRRHLRLQIPSNQEIEALGFGFDSKNNDFKLIGLFNPGRRVELYSLDEGAWRAIDFPLRRELGLVRFSDTRCFLNGNVHWITEYDTQNSPKVLVLKFNVEKERFEMMQLPPNLFKAPFSRLEVTVIEGCLSVLLYDGTPPLQGTNGWCDIWMMTVYGVVESWIKIGKVHLQDGGQVFGVRTSSRVFVHWSNWAGRKFSSLHSLDPNNQEITDLGIPGRAITACEYTGSLVLLNKA